MDTFLTSVREFVESEQLFAPDSRLLLGVSGGMDSTALVYALLELGYEVGMCHVNFQLRGSDSNKDAEFVEALGRTLDIPTYITEMNTVELAAKAKVSIQEVARQIRYEFFEKIRKSEGFDYICTAHHLDDQIETVFFRWIKGSGWNGLLGIPAVNALIRRPFLTQKKGDIAHFCRTHQIHHREDASNQSDKYDRNYIRHHLIPAMSRINPSYHQTFLHQNRVLQSSFDFYRSQVKAYWQDKVFTKNKLIYADVSNLREVAGGMSVLFDLLSIYSFQSEANRQIFEDILTGKSGTLYLSNTHEVLLFRKELCIRSKDDQGLTDPVTLSVLQTPLIIHTEMGIFTTSEIHEAPHHRIALKPEMLPLQLRTWQNGDYFHPMGMDGKTKKLSDYFNDVGVNRFERDRMMLLCRDAHVLWVPGYRLDESVPEIAGELILSFIPHESKRRAIDVFE